MLFSITEQMVSALQYFLDTFFGALMMFLFSQVAATKKNVLSMVLLGLVSYSLVLIAIVRTNQASVGVLYSLFVHLPFILWYVFVFRVPASLVFVSHFLTYNILSSRILFGSLSFLILQDVAPGMDPAIAIRIGWILSGPPVVLASLYLLARRLPELVSQNRGERMLLLQALGAAYLVIQLLHFSDIVERDMKPLLFSLMFSILLFSFIISIYMYATIVKESEAIKARNTAYSIQAEGLALLTEAMSDYLGNTARIRHDLRHFLSMIDLHARKGDIPAIRNLVADNLGVIDCAPMRVTGDDMLDGIIALFRKRGEAHGIAITVTGNALVELPAARDDLGLLLSNCLENAIEATKNAPEGTRQISVSVTRHADTGTIALLVRNPYVGKVEFGADGLPVSHRGDNHGFGTRSMKLIVTKYNGLCGFSAEQGHFCFRAAFFAATPVHSPSAK